MACRERGRVITLNQMISGVPDQRLLTKGVRAHQAGNLEKAQDIYARYRAKHPRVVIIDYLLGHLAHYMGWHEEALALMLYVVERRPTFTLAVYNAGRIHQELTNSEAAKMWYLRALELDPYMVAAWTNLGCAYMDLGDPREAANCFSEAAKMEPDNPEARYNRAHALIVTGAWLKGWTDHECRWALPGYANYHVLPRLPMWKGQPLAGKSLLVDHEQGFGDTIMLLRYHEMLTAEGANVVWRVPPSLYRLVADAYGEDHVADQTKMAPECDYVVGGFSLPHMLGTITKSVPCSDRYLRAVSAPPYIQSTNVRVGFVWQGSSSFKNDRNRSMNIHDWEPLFNVPGCTWYCLQKHATDEDRSWLKARPSLSTEVTPVEDWAGTASLIQQMDLVVTVDTGVAHLAGALGIPVWIFVASSPDFRWLLEREDSVWYDSARLFRQKRNSDWGEVVERVRAELLKWPKTWPMQEEEVA